MGGEAVARRGSGVAAANCQPTLALALTFDDDGAKLLPQPTRRAK